MGALVFPVAPQLNTHEPDLGQHSNPPACPPYSEEAHDLLKRFVASSLPHTGGGVTVEAVSPSELVWVAQHPKCAQLNSDEDSNYFATVWRSNQYYFIYLALKPPKGRIEGDDIYYDELIFARDSIDVYDLEMNRIWVFLL